MAAVSTWQLKHRTSTDFHSSSVPVFESDRMATVNTWQHKHRTSTDFHSSSVPVFESDRMATVSTWQHKHRTSTDFHSSSVPVFESDRMATVSGAVRVTAARGTEWNRDLGHVTARDVLLVALREKSVVSHELARRNVLIITRPIF
jgi:hypothetical protein